MRRSPSPATARAVLVSLLVGASTVPRAGAAQPAPEASSARPAATSVASPGLGYEVAIGVARGGRGGAGDETLSGRALRVGRARWLGRWFRLRTDVQYHDLRRDAPTACDEACPPFEQRRRLLATGLAVEWHHRTDRWHLYPVLGVGAGYARSTGAESRVGLTREMGVGAALPVPGGWPTLAAELRLVRVPRPNGHAWHLPLAIDVRF